LVMVTEVDRVVVNTDPSWAGEILRGGTLNRANKVKLWGKDGKLAALELQNVQVT